MLYMAVRASRVPKPCLAAGLGLQRLAAAQHCCVLLVHTLPDCHALHTFHSLQKTTVARTQQIGRGRPAATLSACSACRVAQTPAPALLTMLHPKQELTARRAAVHMRTLVSPHSDTPAAAA